MVPIYRLIAITEREFRSTVSDGKSRSTVSKVDDFDYHIRWIASIYRLKGELFQSTTLDEYRSTVSNVDDFNLPYHMWMVSIYRLPSISIYRLTAWIVSIYRLIHSSIYRLTSMISIYRIIAMSIYRLTA